jgi:heme-degrading monooxygenase HmoA
MHRSTLIERSSQPVKRAGSMMNIRSLPTVSHHFRNHMMIFEVAVIDVKPGLTEAFELGVAQALPVFSRAEGYKSLRLERSIETPLRYRLVVGWETVDHHIVGFRNSPDFHVWRSLVGHTFAAPPAVEHTNVVLTGLADHQ